MTRMPITLAAGVAMLLALSACNNKREAQADTGNAKAEVSTSLPESQVSNDQLKAAAEGAAAVAETPQGSNTAVVVTPPPEPTTSAPSTGAAAPPPQK